MRGTDAADFSAGRAEDKTAQAGPLFGGQPVRTDGPFAQSKVQPCPLEIGVAGLIWQHKGRGRPISIAEIIEHWGGKFMSGRGLQPLTERAVKETVEQLRLTHHCPIGARRGEPSGYFWIVDAEDREVAVRPYREQVKAMWRTLRALDYPAALRELHGQLRLEE